MIESFLLKRPYPTLEYPYQSGISDPRFPLLAPSELENEEEYDLYKGLVDKQKHIAIIKASVLVKSQGDLKILMHTLSDMAYSEMNKTPSKREVKALDISNIPESWRETITISFGYSLFVDKYGNDRFNIADRKPKNLKLIPKFPGDEFEARETISDILILIASDHPYINVASTRYFAEYTDREFAKKKGAKKIKQVFKITSVEKGFGRPDSREFLKFNDGIDNLRANIDLERLVYIDELSGEPKWCIGGSYLVYKKIREMMPVWEAFTTKTQENIIGRKKDSSLPLSRIKEGVNDLTPVYPNPTDKKDGPLNAHIRKVQPRRPYPDLFGVNDLDRRFLRRAYPFFDGVDDSGKSINGLHFIAFMKSIQNQFEHVTNMWQMNPNFPKKGTGIDALYAKNVLKSLEGGYYFCPPSRIDETDFIGSGLFVVKEDKKYDIPAHIYGYGITFIDIDETIFKTYAKVKVVKNGEVVRELTNQEFNDYKPKGGEEYDFGEFKDATTFIETSEPIISIITRVKQILKLISSKSEGSRIVFLTARSDFDNKEKFLNTFRKYGIDIDSSRMYVERTGNLKGGSVAEKKKKVVIEYLSKGKFRRVRLIDDNEENLIQFLSIKNELNSDLINLVRKNHSLNENTDPIRFEAYKVDHSGNMFLINKSKIDGL